MKLLLAIAAFDDLELNEMDTTTAFISASLKPGTKKRPRIHWMQGPEKLASD
jgi:hypothetical protein